MRVLLIGGHGMLGADIAGALAGDDLATPGSGEVDVLNPEDLREECRRVRPEVLISTAAFHRVDDCETQVEHAFRLNAVATRNLALAAREVGARFAWISTDYVFSGTASEPYEADAEALPANVYGASKLAGEHLIRATTPDHLILRTSGLYGLRKSVVKRTNFVDTILRLIREGREEIAVVSDQVCTPTFTRDLARALRKLLETPARGTFHITNSGSCSWADFAERIVELTSRPVRIRRITSAEYGAAAARPPYSVLGHGALNAAGVPSPRDWTEALPEFLKERFREAPL